MIRLVESAALLPGVRPGGFDPSHGAPHELFVNERVEGSISMLATYADDEDLALGLIYTEGQESTLPEKTEVDGQTVIVYPPNSRDTSAVMIEGVCGEYDLWAFWFSPDTATLVADVVWVVNQTVCPLD